MQLASLYEDVKRGAKRFDKLSLALQHRVRKRLKRLRYLAEFAAPLLGAKSVGSYLKRWRKAQDALGENNDHRVGVDLRRGASSDVAARRARRWISVRTLACVEGCNRLLRKALKAPVFWERLNRRRDGVSPGRFAATLSSAAFGDCFEQRAYVCCHRHHG